MNNKTTKTFGGIKAGSSTYRTMEMEVAIGTYKAGELLEMDDATNVLSKQKTADKTKFFGIMTEDIEITVAKKVFVFVKGVFIRERMVLDTGVTLDKALELQARKLGIYFE